MLRSSSLLIAIILASSAILAKSAGRIGKSTYACSETAATKAYAWETKYLPVEEANDDCKDRTCKCGKQSRVALKTSSSTADGGPQGFGIHCTYAGGKDDSRAAANGGMTEEQLEAAMEKVIGNWSTYSTDVNVYAWASYATGLWAESGLDWYINAFDTDSVSYHKGSWKSSSGKTYWSVHLLIPHTPVVLELMGSCTVCGDEDAHRMPHGYSGVCSVPSSSSSPHGTEAASQGILSAKHISRAVSNMSAVVEFYDTVYGLSPSSNSTLENGAEVMEFQPGGDSVSVRYVQMPGQTGSFTTDDFQKLLLSTADKYQTSPSACWPIWGDLHVGGSYGSQTILEQVTKAGKLGLPYRSFAGGAGPSNAYMVDPSGAWIQIGGDSTGLPDSGGFDTQYCYTFCQ